MRESKDEFLALGKRLRTIRRSLNLRQIEMSENLGISISYLSDIELAKRKPSPDFFLKLSKKYNVSLDYLFRGIGEMFLLATEKNGQKPFDFNENLDTIDKLTWLMENSPFFKNTVMGFASKLALNEEDTVKASLKKQREAREDLLKGR